jgi:hypothetical protein
MINSENEAREAEHAQAEPGWRDLDKYASYEEDGSLVVCDRTNASAWVKSNVTTPVED